MPVRLWRLSKTRHQTRFPFFITTTLYQISRENAKSELVVKRSNSSSAAVVELIDDERKVSPSI